MSTRYTCDIFCTVVDNFGDIGVCWRLAQILSGEHPVAVRLWVDDLQSFHRLAAEIDPALPQQHAGGVEIRFWNADFSTIHPAQLVIEAFACALPEAYLATMAAQPENPVWVALEHLSAEDWVSGYHRLPSPHPVLPLTRYFFFPGFTKETGGLLLENGLLTRRDAFQHDPDAQLAFWNRLGVPAAHPEELRVSLFCYENQVVEELFSTWSHRKAPLCCLVPEGRILTQIAGYFGRKQLSAGDILQDGRLEVRVLPFMDQDDYDQLLWACDINFVRGEDSFVRAQWAGRPFIWHIYPQHDGVHQRKLQAFMARYGEDLPAGVCSALHETWEIWNDKDSGDIAAAWQAFEASRVMLRQHTLNWAGQLSTNNLASNLLDFFREIGKIRAS